MATGTITKLLDDLNVLPESETVEPDEDQEQSLTHWGYTIYRTYYGPGSDEQWSELLKKIANGVEQRLPEMDEADEEPDAVTKVWDQFRLDARSVAATLDGLTLEDVRQVYLDGSGGQPMKGIQSDNWGNAVFLVADAPVLQDPDLRLLKVSTADYDAVAAVPRNTRSGQQRYFGWMTMPTTAVLDLYSALDTFTFEEIVGHTSGGPGAFWHPDDS
jgi:hypothetical protein